MKTYLCLSGLLAAILGSGVSQGQEVAVVKEKHVNVRGQPNLTGEVITQLQQGEKVTILEDITVDKPKPGEPAKWVRIQMPANTPVWAFGAFVDPTSKTVTAKRLNLRAGPGENYSVIGRLEKGDAVKEIRTTGDWMEVETPNKAYAFMAADLLNRENKQGTPIVKAETKSQPQSAPVAPPKPETSKTEVAVAATTIPSPPKTTPEKEVPGSTNIAGNISLTGRIADKPIQSESPALTLKPGQPSADTIRASSSEATPLIGAASEKTPAARNTSANETPPSDAASESTTKRIVRREGVVRSTRSIQAPSYFELISPDSKKTINYLHSEDGRVNLKDYKGHRIVVTGEEGIDPRWPKTPVIEIQSLDTAP